MLPKYVRLLNAEKHPSPVRTILLAQPELVQSHFVAEGEERPQSRPCVLAYFRRRKIEQPLAVCRWCALERQPSSYLYVAMLAPSRDAKKWEPAMLHMPLPFQMQHKERLIRGRVLNVWGTGVRGERPTILIVEGLEDPDKLPAPFDCDAALCRMKLGYVPELEKATETTESPDVVPFPRKQTG
jgi:hypothetical protein